MAEMSQKGCRHLVEQRWRHERVLDLLMEHFHQIRVSPDALPVLQPTVDLRVILPKDVALCARAKRKIVLVEAGAFSVYEQTRRLPKLYATPFHPEPRFYTLLIQVIPSLSDVPLLPNISLSATFAGLLPSIAHTPYVLLHPAWGMSCHRYVLPLPPHVDPSAMVSLPPAHSSEMVSTYERLRRNMRLGLMAGMHLCGERTVIWREVIKKPEPRYGYPPKPDPYTGSKEVKRYA
ncbi:PEBP-like protein [Lactarius deliciosus]|nr:PEBP-like protein [Lactarius deliciosus]